MSGLLAANFSGLARADTFPAKPIHFICPFAAGGTSDAIARLVGQHMTKIWGQPILVESKPGAGTVIGSNYVAKAPADGHTILFVANSLVINAKLQKNLPYDGIKAFEMVASMLNSPQVIVVNAGSPFHTLKQLIDAARSQPETVSMATNGPATNQHIAAALLQRVAGVRFIYVPYAGSNLAVNAVLGGHVSSVLGNLSDVSVQIEAGKLRALAITTRERVASLKDVPTVAESGYPGYEVVGWFGVAAPAGTPPEVIAKLADGLDGALKDTEIRQRLIAFGLQPAFLGPQAFTTHIANEYERYSRVIDEAGIKAG